MSTLTGILVVVGILTVAYVVGSGIFKFDTRVEKRRYAAIKLAGILREYGLTKLPCFLDSYAVGDYSQMADDIADTVKMFLAGDEVVLKEFDRIFTNVLAAKLQTEEGCAYIASKLGEAVEATKKAV